jgi:Arc/MetJ-type ribon-helix-helix transcriptional regulator
MERRRRNGWWNSLSFESDFKRRQLGRVLLFTLAYVAVSTVAVAVVYSISLRPLAVGQLPFYLRAEQLQQAGGVPGLTETLAVWVTLMTSLSAFFAIVVGLYFSHKLAGPIYRFKLELQRIADGRGWRAIRLRKGDDFHDVADVLNRALEHVQSTENLLRQQLEHAEHRLQELWQALRDHPNDRERLEQILSKLESERAAH